MMSKYYIFKIVFENSILNYKELRNKLSETNQKLQSRLE